jgi:5-methyltetrahydrofolate--homocysteine methyltransferase
LVGAKASCGCGHDAARPRSGRPTGLAEIRENDDGSSGSTVDRDAPIPVVPFRGSRVAENIDPAEVYPYINKRALFRGQWGFKRGALSKEEFERTQQTVVEPAFERLCRQLREERLLDPRVGYGYYPCASVRETIVIYDPDDHDREIERFTFPRQKSRRRLCLADYFRPLGSMHTGERDVIGFFVCTVGERITPYARRLFEKNEYTEYLYAHGFGVECAEGLAEYWHRRMRAELGLASADAESIEKLFTQGYQGRRYSFGYPACPEMDDQATLFRLLEPGRIGCELTESMEIDPEQSVSAMVVHHRQATYFQV